MRIRSGQHAVPQDIDCYHVCSACYDFFWKGDEVPSDGDANMVGICLMWLIINRNLSIFDHSILWDVPDLL